MIVLFYLGFFSCLTSGVIVFLVWPSSGVIESSEAFWWPILLFAGATALGQVPAISVAKDKKILPYARLAITLGCQILILTLLGNLVFRHPLHGGVFIALVLSFLGLALQSRTND